MLQKNIRPNPPEQESPKPKALINLGWANSWEETPEIVKNCLKAGHKRTDVDRGPRNRGLEHVVTCLECSYVYRYDSSD